MLNVDVITWCCDRYCQTFSVNPWRHWSVTMSVAVVVSSSCLYRGTCWPLWPQQGPSIGFTLSKNARRGRVLLRHRRGRLQRKNWQSLDSNAKSWTKSVPSLKVMPISWLRKLRGRLDKKMAQLITKSNTLRGFNKKKEDLVKIEDYWGKGHLIKALVMRLFCSLVHIRPMFMMKSNNSTSPVHVADAILFYNK